MKRVNLVLRYDAAPDQLLKFEMVSGELKGYTGSYKLMNATEGSGTVVSTELEMDAGPMAPKFIVDRLVKKIVESTNDAIGKRAAAMAAKQPVAAATEVRAAASGHCLKKEIPAIQMRAPRLQVGIRRPDLVPRQTLSAGSNRAWRTRSRAMPRSLLITGQMSGAGVTATVLTGVRLRKTTWRLRFNDNQHVNRTPRGFRFQSGIVLPLNRREQIRLLIRRVILCSYHRISRWAAQDSHRFTQFFQIDICMRSVARGRRSCANTAGQTSAINFPARDFFQNSDSRGVKSSRLTISGRAEKFSTEAHRDIDIVRGILSARD